MYNPLYNLPKCTGCHGSDHTVRGVIDIRNNITDSAYSQRNSLIIAAALFLGMVAVLTLILMQFLKTAVINPVRAISGVCDRVTQGDFSSRVNIKNKDEIGSLGETVNTMVEGLYERFELSKFVSSSTIQAIGGKEEGKTVTITLLFSDIRGFTSYAEQHDAETVVGNLNNILNAQTKIIHDCGGDVDKYVGDEIISFFTGPESHLCASYTALKIQKELQRPEYKGLQVGIGIHSGKVILGRVGSDTRADFTAIGDNVNIASRLCDAAPPGGILVSHYIRDALDNSGSFEGPFKLKMKGKAQQQYVYRLIKLSVDEEKIHEKIHPV
jgi:class 3 adenylate cyclase